MLRKQTRRKQMSIRRPIETTNTIKSTPKCCFCKCDLIILCKCMWDALDTEQGGISYASFYCKNFYGTIDPDNSNALMMKCENCSESFSCSNSPQNSLQNSSLYYTNQTKQITRIKNTCDDTDKNILELCTKTKGIIDTLNIEQSTNLINIDEAHKQFKSIMPTVEDISIHLDEKLTTNINNYLGITITKVIRESIKELDIQKFINNYLELKCFQHLNDVQIDIPWWSKSHYEMQETEKVIYSFKYTGSKNNEDLYLGVTNHGTYLLRTNNGGLKFEHYKCPNVYIPISQYNFIREYFEFIMQKNCSPNVNNLLNIHSDYLNIKKLFQGTTPVIELQQKYFELCQLVDRLETKKNKLHSDMTSLLSIVEGKFNNNYSEVMNAQLLLTQNAETEAENIAKKYDRELRIINDFLEKEKQKIKKDMEKIQKDMEKIQSEKQKITDRSMRLNKREELTNSIYSKLSDAVDLLIENTETAHIGKEISDILSVCYELTQTNVKCLPKTLIKTNNIDEIEMVTK